MRCHDTGEARLAAQERKRRPVKQRGQNWKDGRGRHGNHARGGHHPRWNLGKIITDEGYVKIRVGVGHPLADPNGYAYEHHLVMFPIMGRPLREDEIIHHKNGDRQDNRHQNLEVMTRSEHAAHHNQEKLRDHLGRFVGVGYVPNNNG